MIKEEIFKELFNANYDSTETFEDLYPTTDIINKEFNREYTRVLFKNKLTKVKEINNKSKKNLDDVSERLEKDKKDFPIHLP